MCFLLVTCVIAVVPFDSFAAGATLSVLMKIALLYMF